MELTRKNLIDYVNNRRKQGVTNATISRELIVLQSIIQRGIDAQIIEDDEILDRLKISKVKPKVEPRKVLPKSGEIIQMLRVSEKWFQDLLYAATHLG